MIKNSIRNYYDSLAKDYDKNRFENSYGKYIDQQERLFLDSFIKNRGFSKILDLGCGTGRLLDFATHGTDFSPEMIKIARTKYPEKTIAVGEISDIPFHVEFDCIFCFHVIMHQNKEKTQSFLNECYKKLQSNGILIFDFPTKTRRKVVSEQEAWHAANTFTEKEIVEETKKQWKLVKTAGILFFPIHRFPKNIRRLFLPLDRVICNTFLKKWASYNIMVLEKI
ncbi:methyltransferase domain-containing protein [Chryseobacterium camelliae]|uniref:Methyltransferase domain-containing protein n=1 Tax=Chryseobacterium camelliae TaxID=1265445 RepID=A0ABY7QQ68_9FLAO|nr:class I SAM-dependent methyltransferase [Chryseobacterium camelliae]WBV61802.1 methyltransferase domain-containing protein [Chryseobacterium camelliae]